MNIGKMEEFQQFTNKTPEVVTINSPSHQNKEQIQLVQCLIKKDFQVSQVTPIDLITKTVQDLQAIAPSKFWEMMCQGQRCEVCGGIGHSQACCSTFKDCKRQAKQPGFGHIFHDCIQQASTNPADGWRKSYYYVLMKGYQSRYRIEENHFSDSSVSQK